MYLLLGNPVTCVVVGAVVPDPVVCWMRTIDVSSTVVPTYRKFPAKNQVPE